MTAQASARKKPVKLVSIIKAPITAIFKALNLYAKGVTNFSNAYNRPLRTMVEAAPNSQQLPRSFTTGRLPDKDRPSDGALVRSISGGAIDDRATTIKITNFELYVIQRHCHQLQSSASRKVASRSCSVGMGKIDEDRVHSFRNDNLTVLKTKLGVKEEEEEDSVFSKSHNLLSVKRNKFTQYPFNLV